MNVKQPTFIELFAGVGGFRLWFGELHGRKCLWANGEQDKKACKIYKKHFGDNEIFEGDIKNVETKIIPKSEMLCGGFPCQPFFNYWEVQRVPRHSWNTLLWGPRELQKIKDLEFCSLKMSKDSLAMEEAQPCNNHQNIGWVGV